MVDYFVSSFLNIGIEKVVEPLFTFYVNYNFYINFGLFFVFIFLLIRNFMRFAYITSRINEISFAISLSMSMILYYLAKRLFLKPEIVILLISFILMIYLVDFMFSTLIFIFSFLFFMIKGQIYTDIAILISYYNVAFSILYHKALLKDVNAMFAISHDIKRKFRYFVKYIFKSALIMLPLLLIWLKSIENIGFLYMCLVIHAIYALFALSDKIILFLIFSIFIQSNIEENQKAIERKIELLEKLKKDIKEKSFYGSEEILNRIEREIRKLKESKTS